MPKIKKKNNITITEKDGREIIRLKGKIVKKSAVKKFLQAKTINAIKLSKKVDVKVGGSVNIPVTGERVVNLKYMAQNMFCKQCKDELFLSNIVGETVHGLGSIFKVKCPKCHNITKVDSSEKYCNPRTGGKVFEVNTKVAFG